MGWNPNKVAVGVASTAIVAFNALRRGLIIINDSDTDIYLAIAVPAVLNKGIKINAGGGAYEHDIQKYGLPMDAVNGISSGANKNVTINELF